MKITLSEVPEASQSLRGWTRISLFKGKTHFTIFTQIFKIMSFKELNLHEQILHAISYMGFETPTLIQEKVIPHIIENHDIMACAQTGTGKTGAYILPILDKIIRKKTNYANTLILVPTRELAVQIEQQVQGFSYFVSVGSIAIYGGGDGADWEQEKSAL
jgi:superfamily II DNA/RNA helicase